MGIEELSAGTLVGARYRVDRFLGRGGMGAVYAAHDEVLHRLVALKIVQGSPIAAERFVREARAAAAFGDPRIVTIYDVCAHGDHQVLVMELVAGRPLREAVAQPMPWRRAITLVREIASALSAAHERHIVHRDLKPENIMLLDGDRVKLVDFGLARSVGSVGITDSTTFSGTPGYVAPEIALEGKADDPASDRYALGVIAFELLTALAPFQAQTPAALVLLHATQDPPPPSSLVPDAGIPAAVDELVLALMAREAVRRPSCAEACARIGLLLGSEGPGPLAANEATETSTAMPTIPTPAQPVVTARPKRRWRVAAALLAAVAGAGIVVSVAALRDRREGSEATRLRDTLAHSVPLGTVDGQLQTLSVAPGGKKVLYGTIRRLWQVDVPTGAISPVAIPGEGAMLGFQVCPGDRAIGYRFLDAAGERANAVVVDLSTGATTSIAEGITSAVPSPDCAQVAISGPRGVWLVDEAGRETRTLLPPRPGEPPVVCGWTSDDKLVVHSGDDILVVEVRSGKVRTQPRLDALDWSYPVGVVGRQIVIQWAPKGPCPGLNCMQLVATTAERIDAGLPPEPITAVREGLVGLGIAGRDGTLVVSSTRSEQFFRTAELSDDGRTVGPSRLLPGSPNKRIGALGPDGRLYFVMNSPTGARRIYRQRPDRPEVEQVESAGEQASGPTFLGNALVYWTWPTEVPDAGEAPATLVIRENGVDRTIMTRSAGPAVARCGGAVCALAEGDGSLSVVETASGRSRPLAALEMANWGWDLSPDGATLAAVLEDGSIALVDVESGRITKKVGNSGGFYGTLAYLPSGALLASRMDVRSESTSLVRLDPAGDELLVADESDVEGGVSLHDVSPDGRLVAEGIGINRTDLRIVTGALTEPARQ